MKTDRKGIALLATGAALVIASIYGSVETSTADAPNPTNATHSLVQTRPSLPRWMTRPCPTEDSFNCYWNDGGGHPFYVRAMPGDITGLVCWFYVEHKYAANHDHCAPAR